MNKMIPLSVPNLKGNELKYITDAIESEWVSTGGSYIDKFEKNISKYVNVDKAVACQSGTAAIHLALKLCNVERNDEVIVPTLTFIAAINPVKYENAEPIFMDCDDTLNMDLDKLEVFLERECDFINGKVINKKTKRIIKAIIIVHIFGNMVNMEKLLNISSKYNLKVIEDATEALGTYCNFGKYKGKFAGTIADFGIYSFNGNKIMTTGGGGMLVGENNDLLDKAKYLSTQAKDDPHKYYHNEIGYNYRMTNLQAALGVAQLEQLEKFINNKKNNYDLYKKYIDDINGLKIINFNDNTRPNYWFYSVYVNEEKYGLSRDELISKLAKLKIQTRSIWGLIHKQKPYIECQTYNIIKAYKYVENIINIPCSSNLLKDDVERVIKHLNR
jgi:perosamine synthetase